MQLVDTAVFPPGRCAVSGRTDGPFIDTGASIRGFGRLYLHVEFLKQALKGLPGFRAAGRPKKDA